MNNESSEVILFGSPDAAMKVTVEMWRTPNGSLYEHERDAMYAGCTHRRCDSCGSVVDRNSLFCAACSDKAEAHRYADLPRKKWDGSSPAYSGVTQEFYSSFEDAADALDSDHDSLESLRLQTCKPVYGSEIDEDFFCDELPDGDAPEAIERAIYAFNAAVRAAGPLSWEPDDYAVDLDGGAK